MRISDVMTSHPATCIPTDTARTAAQLMKEHDTGIIPIVESRENLRLVGVVTDRDLCITVVAEGKAAETAQVKDSMTGTVVSCHPDDDLKKAEALMREHLVRRIPVVDGDNHIQGIVSIADLLRRDDEAQDAQETLKKVSTPTPEASKARAAA